MASLPYPLNRLNNHGRVGMAGMPYPPTDCRSYIKIIMNTYLIVSFRCYGENIILPFCSIAYLIIYQSVIIEIVLFGMMSMPI